MTNFSKRVIDQDAISNMTNVANLQVAEDLEITVSSNKMATMIYLCLQPNGGEPEYFPLSGFPRLLVTEDESTGMPPFHMEC